MKANTIESGQEVIIDMFRPEDAKGVTELFKSVYGEGYPIRAYVEPDILIQENFKGTIISSVARTPKGDIVGHNALFNSAPNKNIYESGAGLVHKLYRGGKGIFTEMVKHGHDMAIKKSDIKAIFGEAVSNHIFSQKLVYTIGWQSCAIEMDLMPGAAYTKEKTAKGRVSSILDFMLLNPEPNNIYLPPVYEKELKFIYQGLDKKIDFQLCNTQPSKDAESKIDIQTFDFAGVARLTVESTGNDFETMFSEIENRLVNKGVIVIQLWLKLSSPWNDFPIDILRRKKYFFGGLLPQWFNEKSDGILMQKTMDPPHFDEMNIHFERAKKIAEYVKEDWKTVNRS